MFREALAFPRNREGATRDLLLGGGLVLGSVLVVPMLLLWGYLLAVMDAGARGREVPPPIDDWGQLLSGGVRALVVVLVWGVFPLLVLAGGVFAAAVFVLPLNVDSLWLNVSAVTTGAAGVFGGVALALLSLAVVLWLHLPAALAAVATQGRVGAGFRTGALWSVVATSEYVRGVVLAVVVAGVGSVFGLVLAPVLVGFVVLFYTQVAAAFLLGRAFGSGAVTAIRPT